MYWLHYFNCSKYILFNYKKDMIRSFIYPCNNFGHHNNVQYYFYSRYVTQGNNWNGYGLHQVEIRNETDQIIEVVGWHMKEGRVQENFRVSQVKPGLFYTARLVPNSWGTYKAIVGAVTFRTKGTNNYFTLAFEDPFHDYVNSGYKGHIQDGNNPEHAISQLRDHSPKSLNWGSYEFKQFDGRGKSVITIGHRR